MGDHQGPGRDWHLRSGQRPPRFAPDPTELLLRRFERAMGEID